MARSGDNLYSRNAGRKHADISSHAAAPIQEAGLVEKSNNGGETKTSIIAKSVPISRAVE